MNMFNTWETHTKTTNKHAPSTRALHATLQRWIPVGVPTQCRLRGDICQVSDSKWTYSTFLVPLQKKMMPVLAVVDIATLLLQAEELVNGCKE
jgi:hypothetical protein